MPSFTSMLSSIICIKCEKFFVTDGKTLQIHDDYGNARRVSVYKCPSCGFEVFSGMGKVFEKLPSENKGDIKLKISVE